MASNEAVAVAEKQGKLWYQVKRNKAQSGLSSAFWLSFSRVLSE